MAIAFYIAKSVYQRINIYLANIPAKSRVSAKQHFADNARRLCGNTVTAITPFECARSYQLSIAICAGNWAKIQTNALNTNVG